MCDVRHMLFTLPHVVIGSRSVIVASIDIILLCPIVSRFLISMHKLIRLPGYTGLIESSLFIFA